MKRYSFLKLGLIGLLALAISGCNGFEEQKLPDEKVSPDEPFSIIVSPETKTQMSGDKDVVWKDDDAITVFVVSKGVVGKNYKFERKTTGDENRFYCNDFDGVLDTQNDWYVFYPYTAKIGTPMNSSEPVIVGSAANGRQTQAGNSSRKHLAGDNIPLYGKGTFADGVVPTITLNQALSVIKVRVTNNTAAPLTVSEVSFTAPKAIVGSFAIDFSGDNPIFTVPAGQEENKVSNAATLTVNEGLPIAKGKSADFYLAVKPFTATSGSTLTLAVNGYAKTITLDKAVEFEPGLIKTLNFNTPDNQDVFPPLIPDWMETSLSNINPGDVFVMVGNDTYGVDNTLNTSAGGPTPVPVTVDNTKADADTHIVGKPGDNIKWTLTGNNTDGYIFYSYADDSNFLYCSTTATNGSNDNMRVGPTGERNRFVIEDGHLKTNDDNVARYIGINGTSDFRGYTGSATNSVTFKFYKQDSKYAEAYAITVDPLITGGSVKTDPEIEQYETSIVKLTATPETGNFFTSWDVYKTDDSSVKVTVENDQFTMPGYPVTVSAVFGEASLTVSGTTPEKAECTAGSEVTFTVTSNVAWTASSGSAIITDISPAGTQSPSADPQTVTVTLAANSGKERTATVSVNPVDQEQYFSLNKTVTVTQEQIVSDCVELPWEYPTGDASATSAGLMAINGVTAVGLGSDYGDSHSPYQIKLDNTNDCIIIQTGSVIGVVSIKYKMIGGANSSSITVQESSDGSSYTDVQSLSIAGAQNSTGVLETTNTFKIASRYVKLVFVKGSNVGIGGISITEGDSTVWDLKSIAVTTAPTKTTYTEGEYFDPTGLVVTPTFEERGNTGNTKVGDPVDNSDLTFEPGTSTALTTANTSVTIGYTVSDITKTTTQAITVNSASAITYYEKVTTAPSDWSGDYLMVCENQNLALSSISTTSTKYGIGTGVTISDGKILSNSTTNPYKLVIAPATGGGSGYTIKFGDNYLYWQSGNSLATNASESNYSRWTITAGATTGNWIITNVAQTTRVIWYNTGSPRFACYENKDEGTTGYAPIQLYKLQDNTVWDLNGIAVKTAPTKVTYEAGENFDPTGLVITATYSDHDGVKANKTVDVAYSNATAADFSFTPSTALTTSNDNVTITWGGKSTTQEITVAAVYAVTFAAPSNGSITVMRGETELISGNSVPSGATINVTATPASGYELSTLVYNDGSEHDIKAAKTFTMPAHAVSISATFAEIVTPTISMNTTSITGVAAAGVTTTASSAYSLLNGASNDDVEITCDGTVVTAASKNATAGTINYTVSKNTGAARDGWIKVKYGSEDPHTITVSQLAGESVTPTLQYTLDGTVTASGNAYATASTVTQSNIGWKVVGNTEQNPWRIGGKGISNADRAIYSTTAISANITQINVSSGATAGNLTVNSMTISVHNSAADAESGSNAIATKTVTSGIASSTVTFDKEDNTSWAGKYYRIVYNVTRTSTSNNGYITFNNATFYGI